jgi:hypothetical protein
MVQEQGHNPAPAGIAETRTPRSGRVSCYPYIARADV